MHENDPKQLCYLCDEDINIKGKSDLTPGVCLECDEKENPELKAYRQNRKTLQGIQDSEASPNPLNSKPGAKKLKKNIFQGYQGPTAPNNPPIQPLLPPEDDEGGNPLNR